MELLQEQISLLENSQLSCNKFSFEGQEHLVKVVKCYDGDTITVNFWFDGKIQQFSIRMEGYDSPEKRSKDPEEKRMAKIARDALADKVLDKIVKMKCGEFDKYGRLLGTIFIKSENENENENNDNDKVQNFSLSNYTFNINEYMENSKFGLDYHGKTKTEFKDAHDFYSVPDSSN